jgi:hypothetical protein
VPESLIPPDADHVPVNGPMMTVAWIVTGTEVLAEAGAAVASVAPPASAAATAAAAIRDLTLIRGSFMIALPSAGHVDTGPIALQPRIPDSSGRYAPGGRKGIGCFPMLSAAGIRHR